MTDAAPDDPRPSPVPVRAVSRFEVSLLRILHCFLQRAPLEQALPLILERAPRPKCLTRAAVELVEDALAKGTMLLLARDGWRREKALRAERVVEGRLWDRTAPEDLGMTFSRHSLDFLIWITANHPGDEPAWRPPADELTVGDEFLLFLAYQALRDTDLAVLLRKFKPVANHGLCWLAFPGDFIDSLAGGPPRLFHWVERGSPVLEAVQTSLTARWVAVEAGKRQLTDWRRMQALGTAQEHALNALFGAVERLGRRDLTRFLLRAARLLLVDNLPVNAWIGHLDLRGLRLAERRDVYRSALVVLRSLERLREWEQQARAVGYFDDGYAASQLWKADWQRWDGDAVFDQAQRHIRASEPLAT